MSPQSLHLTTRDYETLSALGSYRFLSALQLSALLFPSEDAATRRLRDLTRAGLVLRLPVPIRSHEGSPSAVYALRTLGASYVARVRGGVRPPCLTPKEERTGHFLEHTLARNDVRIVLDRLGQLHPRFTLLSWLQDKPEVLRTATVQIGRRLVKRVTFVPDGVAIVRVGHECQALAIEIDRATVNPKHMALRYRAYWRYWRDGGARHDYGPCAFRVLTITTERAHLERLLRVARQAPDGRIGTKLLWFALAEEVRLDRPEQLLSPVWDVASRNPMRSQPLFSPPLLK